MGGYLGPNQGGMGGGNAPPPTTGTTSTGGGGGGFGFGGYTDPGSIYTPPPEGTEAITTGGGYDPFTFLKTIFAPATTTPTSIWNLWYNLPQGDKQAVIQYYGGSEQAAVDAITKYSQYLSEQMAVNAPVTPGGTTAGGTTITSGEGTNTVSLPPPIAGPPIRPPSLPYVTGVPEGYREPTNAQPMAYDLNQLDPFAYKALVGLGPPQQSPMFSSLSGIDNLYKLISGGQQ